MSGTRAPEDPVDREVIPYASLSALLRSPPPPLLPPLAEADSPAQVTVAMPARNAAPFIATALRSVLAQEGVRVEVVVVDDASEDGTAATVTALDDPRVRLLRNPERRGIGYCHNRVLRHSRAPNIAHVDADDVLLPGALLSALRTLDESPRIGQVFCDFFEIDAEGGLTQAEYRRRCDFFLRHRNGRRGLRRDLLVHGMVVNHLRVYRKRVFDVVGTFDERLRAGEDYEMAVRIAERFELRHVPHFLYCQRVHGGNTERAAHFRALRSWWRRRGILERLLRAGDGTLLGRSALEVRALAWLGLLHVLRLPGAAKAVARRPYRLLAGRWGGASSQRATGSTTSDQA